jgi:hypothetical protein
VSFGPATNFAVGADPLSVAIGDLNGDGKLDLATANSEGTVSILLGTGTGTFGSATNFSAGPVTHAVVIGDLNGDGNPDLAVVNRDGVGVSIFLGDGTGAFGSATDFGVGATPLSIAIDDLNGDGKLDLAVANLNSNDVSILLGTGTGTFGSATNFSAGGSPHNVKIGDLNGDGKPDLAVANVFNNTVSILLGDGTGAFGSATDFAVGTNPNVVAIGDLDGDGVPDLAVANAASDNVSILLGTGTGTFGPATNFAAVSFVVYVAIGDLNGDGKPDLAVANCTSNNVSILLGTGTGSFGSATNFAVGTGPHPIAIEDLNGDGKLDLAVGNRTSNNVSILINNTNDTTPLTVDAGGPYTVNESSSVTLTAIGTDPEGQSLIYVWDLDDNDIFETSGQIVSFTGVDGPAIFTVSVQVTDNGNLTAVASATVTVNNIAPTVGTPVVSTKPSTEGSNVTASAIFSDPGVNDAPFSCIVNYGDGSGNFPGIVSGNTCSGPEHVYPTFGTYTVTINVTDKDGSTGSNSTTHIVIFNWSGFFQPVDNLPTLNLVKAGSAIPVKFSLGGNEGLNIFAAGYPQPVQIACNSGALMDDIEQTVNSGASSLSYSASNSQYTYVWKTEKTWAGTCRQLIIKLIDGTIHRAIFKFK